MSETMQIEEDVFKEKKKFLKRYLRIMKRVERLEQKLAQLDDRLTSISGRPITDMPKGGIPMTLDDLLANKMETEERINTIVQESRKIRKEILNVLDGLEDVHHVEVLELFFINGLQLEDIAERMGYTTRHTVRFYTDGIKALDWPCQ